MTPVEYLVLGAGLLLRWGVHDTPFGRALFVVSASRLVRLAFLVDDALDSALAEARKDWLLSQFAEDPTASAGIVRQVRLGECKTPVPLLLKGTPFQIEVWRALLRVPRGSTLTYGALARQLGRAGAARAVGSACGANRIGLLVPCHRLVGGTGALTGYLWGIERKRAILVWERACLTGQPAPGARLPKLPSA
jgi:AraC family transcriptional regulator of adaptative response/methylated-DNA-[protein]-cysteine methyltransferase